jgi:hypothetical protein
MGIAKEIFVVSSVLSAGEDIRAGKNKKFPSQHSTVAYPGDFGTEIFPYGPLPMNVAGNFA